MGARSGSCICPDCPELCFPARTLEVGFSGSAHIAIARTKLRSPPHAHDLVARDPAGNTTERIIDGPFSIETTTDVDGGPAVCAFALVGNTPNPFNPRTTISYEVPEHARVELSLYDLAGRFVRTLLQESHPGPARYEVTSDGFDTQGRSVSSGVYVHRLRAGDFEDARRMVLTK